MGKVYKIPASFICSVSGTGNDLSQDYGSTPYRAGINGSNHYGTYAKFNGLSGIDGSKITKITLHIQRITGGTDIRTMSNCTILHCPVLLITVERLK